MVKEKMTKKKTKRNVYRGKQKNNFGFILIFIFLAVLTIIGLEYIRYRKGQNSFIFGNKILKKSKIKKTQQIESSFDDKVQILLQKKRVKFSHFIDPAWNYHHYKFELQKNNFINIIKNLKVISKKYGMFFREVEKAEKEMIYLYSVSKNERVSHKFLISIINKKKVNKQTLKKVVPKTNKPKIAFIIDDVGYHNTDANDLKSLGIPITGSVITSTPYAREEAKKLYAFGLETMIHLPMQAKDPNLKYPKNEFIVMSSDINDIIRLIDEAIKKNPFARGLNNHMGSLITSNKAMISKVLTIVKKRGLFFVDSRTASTTVAGSVARQMGIKTVDKDIFIDHIQTYDDSIKRIETLIRIALQKGKGVGIGHPHQTTFQAIKDSVKKIKAKGIDIVFVSDLLE
jgi:polysaccharide deacetylase 2 family uncharacterized protein YibQ